MTQYGYAHGILRRGLANPPCTMASEKFCIQISSVPTVLLCLLLLPVDQPMLTNGIHIHIHIHAQRMQERTAGIRG